MLACAYVIATVAMLFTALSYRQMVKVYPIAGSVYTYVQRAINPYIGFLSGCTILLDYILLPMLNFVIASLYIPLLIPVPGWAVILIQISLVTFINLRGIQTISIINNICVIVQVLFLAALLIFSFRWLANGGGAGTLVDFSAIYNSVEFSKPEVGVTAILGGASILAISFIGFDSVTTLSEETKNPEETIGKALIIICLVIGLLFIVSSYIFQLSWPSAWSEIADPDTGILEYFVYIGVSFMSVLFSVLVMFSSTASAIACQVSASRILFGMGRDGVLPKKFFGHVSEKAKAPSYNIILIAIISLVAIVMDLELATSLINFGALLGFVLVNLSVISHYYIKKKMRGGTATFKYLILPIIGAAVCFSIWIGLDGRCMLLGFGWLAICFIYLAITTRFFRKLPPEMDMVE
jgi:amino acid transporter